MSSRPGVRCTDLDDGSLHRTDLLKTGSSRSSQASLSLNESKRTLDLAEHGGCLIPSTKGGYTLAAFLFFLHQNLVGVSGD